MDKKNSFFCKFLSALNLLLIFVGLFFVSCIAYFKPLIRDDLKSVFGEFFFESSRFISCSLMMGIFKISDAMNLHFLDVSPYCQTFLYVIIYGLIFITTFYPFFFENNIFLSEKEKILECAKSNCFDIKKFFLPILIINFFFLLFVYIIIEVFTHENVVTYDYIMFISVYFVFLYYQYDLLINKAIPSTQKIIFYSLIALVFGFSIEFLHLFWIFACFWYLLYSFLRKKSLLNIYSYKSLIPLFIFLFCLFIFYFGNPKFLDTGFADREEVSYGALYQSLFLIKERFLPFLVDGIYGIIIKNKIFVSTIILLITAYIPFFKINFKFKNVILFQIIGALTLFFLHILIGSDNWNGAQAVIQYGKTTPTFFLCMVCFSVLLIYGIMKDFHCDSNKIKSLKLFIIITSILIPAWNFNLLSTFENYKYSINFNKDEQIKEFIREKIYVHYAKKNEVAILPLSLHYHYEYIHEEAEFISANDVHKDAFFPTNYVLKNVLKIKDEDLCGYYFEDDKIAWEKYYNSGGEVIDTSKINYTSLIEEYNSYRKKQ